MDNDLNKMEVLLLIMLVSLATFSTNLYVPALPAMAALFHVNSTLIQQSMVSFTYGFAVCMLLSGVLADAIGRKKTVLIGLLIYCAASFTILFCKDFTWLIFLRFFQGLGGCCGTVVARVLVRDKFNDKHAVCILALLSSGMAIAFIVGPMVGSFLVELFSWKACFVLMLLLGTSMLVLTSCIFSEPMKACKKINIRCIFSQYCIAIKSQSFLIHTFVTSMTWTGFFLIMMEYPFIVITQLKFSVVNFGVIFSIILLGYLVGTKIARKLSFYEFSSDNAVMYGILIMCFAGVVALLDMVKINEIILTLSGFLYLLGIGIQIPNSQFAAIPAEAKGSATITSLFYFIEMISVALLNNLFKAYFSISASVLWSVLLCSMMITLFVFIGTVSSRRLYCRTKGGH